MQRCCAHGLSRKPLEEQRARSARDAEGCRPRTKLPRGTVDAAPPAAALAVAAPARLSLRQLPPRCPDSLVVCRMTRVLLLEGL